MEEATDDTWDDTLIVQQYEATWKKVQAALNNKTTECKPAKKIPKKSDPVEKVKQVEEATSSLPPPKASSSTAIPPPPPSPFFMRSGQEENSPEEDALASMLMSWYMSGYHTGYYQATKKFSQQKP